MERTSAGTSRYGKYLLLDRIGQGGMSEVFLAKTEGIEGFERKVALKRIFPSLTEQPEFVESFIHEAKVGGMLYHHNVVQTLDFGRVDGTYYIALEYIEGTNLGEVLYRCRELKRKLHPGVFLQLAMQICEGLEYIHHATVEGEDLNLVHRDIKPSNMLITAQGVVKISDFGVVKAERLAGRTRVGSLKGTIGYMAPEQARGDPVGPLCDLYALGAMLYELATLRRLYGDGDELTILQRVKDTDFQSPVETAGALIPGLERVLRRLLSLEPKDRYQSAAQVAQALRALPAVVSDRPTVVTFLRGLGLLEPRPKDTGLHAKVVLRQDGRPVPAGSEEAKVTPAGPPKAWPALPLAADVAQASPLEPPGRFPPARPELAPALEARTPPPPRPPSSRGQPALREPSPPTPPRVRFPEPHAGQLPPVEGRAVLRPPAEARGSQPTLEKPLPKPPFGVARPAAMPAPKPPRRTDAAAPTFAIVGRPTSEDRRPLLFALTLVITLALLLGGFLYSRGVGHRQQLSYPLPPGADIRRPQVWVQLQTVPTGAEVLIDNVLVADSTPVRLPAWGGQRVTLRLEGYRPWSRVVEPGAASTEQSWVVTLNPR